MNLKFSICVLALWWPIAAAAQEPPSLDEQDAILDGARELALRYVESLPNFICTETVQRFIQPRGQDWRPLDTLKVDLAFSEKGERYKLMSIDGKATNKPFGKTGGFTSTGEFGTLLEWIFQPRSQTKFEWQACSDLRGRQACIYAYHVERSRSGYTIDVQSAMYTSRLISAFGGLLYIDRETQQVLSLTHAPEGLPLDWSVRETHSTLDYGVAEIEGRKFLLPNHAEMVIQMHDGSGRHNVTDFRDYRKFSAEATLSFEKQDK